MDQIKMVFSSKIHLLEGLSVIFFTIFLILGSHSPASTGRYINVNSQKKPTNLDELGKAFDALNNEGKYKEGAELLEQALDQLPVNVFDLTDMLILVYNQMGQYPKVLDQLEYGLARNFFYFISPSLKSHLSDDLLDRFEKITLQNERLKNSAQKEATVQYKVFTPEGYSKQNAYPLFIILNGANETIEYMKTYWTSPRLKKEFITAFIRSSEVSSSKGFTWYMRIPQGRQEILECYHKIIKHYHVDRDRILIGGFSVGGTMAIDVMLNKVIPVKEFLAACPGKPESFDSEKVKKAAAQGMKGILIGGENEYYLPYQMDMIKNFKEAGFHYDFIVIPQSGHEVPEDFSQIIDEALNKFIQGGKNDTFQNLFHFTTAYSDY
jgi:predicted esterase